MTRASRHALFWLCCAATMCVAIAANFPPVYLTTFSETFGGADGLTEEQLGRISALVFIGFVFGIAVASPLADRLGAKIFVMAGLGYVCSGLALLGWASTYTMLLVAVFLLGIGAGTLEVVMSPVVAALQPHRRTAALNWMHSFYCVGAIGTVVIGSAALHFDVSWRAVAFGIIAVPAPLFVGFALIRHLPLVHEDPNAVTHQRLYRNPFFIATLMLIFLGGATEIGVAQWLPAYAERELGFTKATGGMALAAFSVAMMVGRMAIGFLVSRVKPLTVMMVCCGAACLLILFGSFVPHAPTALIACVAVGLPICCFWPTTLGLASDRFPRGGATMFGTMAAFGNTGCMTMPWIVGIYAERSNLSGGLALVAVCPVIMAGILTAIALAAGRKAALPKGQPVVD